MDTFDKNMTKQYVLIGNFVASCDLLEHSMLNCNGVVFERLSVYSTRTKEFWLFVGAYIFLTLLSGYLSCLVLAISSVDVTTVRVIWRTGKKSDKALATKMFMLIRRYHQVIVALVAINASAIETMPILLDRISNSIVAISVTCLVILLFDDLVLVLTYLCYPISFPLGYILDVIIGKDVGHLYRRQELKELISRHGPRRDHFQSLFEKEEGKLTEPTQFSGQLSSMEVQVIRGILGLSKKTASDALVPLDKVFMVDYQDEIDKAFVLKVLKCAHRHIPVYSSSRKNIVCCISARRVLRVDPNFRIPVYKFIRSTSLTPSECLSVFTVPESQPLFDVVRKFRLGTLPRLAFVVKIERRKIIEVIGITSQQDVLKAMFTDEEPPPPKPYKRDKSSADSSKESNGMVDTLSDIEKPEQSRCLNIIFVSSGGNTRRRFLGSFARA
ncbi:hypothetical protein M513_04667 [Trichuris suis]|uniref:CBS domain-containing protein n=1 Tax=Trichuris suis TaxID=68888 RepID=A0A085MBC4_9BILA|nr:hypothetical protein M513_04667 [Trichuris suis]